MKIAVQGFSLRDELNDDFEGTLDFLRENGFEAYEMGIYFGEEDPRVAAEVRRIVDRFGAMPGCIWTCGEAREKLPLLRDRGLMVESCHLFFNRAYGEVLTDNLESMIAFAKETGIRQYVVSCSLESWDAVEEVLDQLTAVSAALEREGILLAYHNHDKEMAPAGEKTVLEALLDRIPSLSLQPDIGWMEAGGGPVSRILSGYASRIGSLHFKDLLLKERTAEGGIICTPIGSGDVDSLAPRPFLKDMPLLETGLIIDQDNARGRMLDELILGKSYLEKEFPGKV